MNSCTYIYDWSEFDEIMSWEAKARIGVGGHNILRTLNQIIVQSNDCTQWASYVVGGITHLKLLNFSKSQFSEKN